jgi:hypothetical protein
MNSIEELEQLRTAMEDFSHFLKEALEDSDFCDKIQEIRTRHGGIGIPLQPKKDHDKHTSNS